jgi:phage/plasmid-associated DNA primase
MLDATSRVQSSSLYDAYAKWFAETRDDERPLTSTSFGREMKRRGFEAFKQSAMFYVGIRLTRETAELPAIRAVAQGPRLVA